MVLNEPTTPDSANMVKASGNGREPALLISTAKFQFLTKFQFGLISTAISRVR
jgi:hypothetical protein